MKDDKETIRCLKVTIEALTTDLKELRRQRSELYGTIDQLARQLEKLDEAKAKNKELTELVYKQYKQIERLEAKATDLNIICERQNCAKRKRG